MSFPLTTDRSCRNRLRCAIELCCVTLFVASSVAAQPAPTGAEGFESPPVFRAGDILPPEVVKGERYEVMQEVTNDGYMNLFRIASDFGRFEAYGEPALVKLIQEIGALVELDELSKTEVFTDAVKRSAMGQVTAAKEFADRPVETIKGVPGGLKRTFKRYRRDVEEGYDAAKDVVKSDDESEGEEGGEEDSALETAEEVAEEAGDAAATYARKYFGVTGAQRRWAEKLGTDPYTSNEVLRREIKKVARVDAAGGFTVRLAPIPRIPGVSVIGQINKIVWTRDPRELREENVKRLAAMGVDEALIARFIDNPWLSPSYQTYIVAALDSLAGTAARELAVELFAEADSEQEADFHVGNALLLAGFHRSQSAVARLLPGAPILVARATDGRLAAFASVDHLVWTEGLAAAAGRLSASLAELGSAPRQLWLRAGASERCRREFDRLGWTVYENVEFSEGEPPVSP